MIVNPGKTFYFLKTSLRQLRR